MPRPATVAEISKEFEIAAINALFGVPWVFPAVVLSQ